MNFFLDFLKYKIDLSIASQSETEKTVMNKGILGATTIKQASRLMKANVFTCPELIEATYGNIAASSDLNAYVNIRPQEEALKESEESQKRIEKSEFFHSFLFPEISDLITPFYFTD